MALRDILWENEGFHPNQPVWWLEGTAYNEDDMIVSIKYRVPDEVRREVVSAGKIVSLKKLFTCDEAKIIRSDQPDNGRRAARKP